VPSDAVVGWGGQEGTREGKRVKNTPCSRQSEYLAACRLVYDIIIPIPVKSRAQLFTDLHGSTTSSLQPTLAHFPPSIESVMMLYAPVVVSIYPSVC
jgi:hypothetical protein